MGLEIIIFIGSIVFGVLLYWRESNGNGAYRTLNKIVNSKELQMKATDKKGFIYQQNFLLRLVYLTIFFLVLFMLVEFLTPISIFNNYFGISTFASSIVGALIGTYVATFVIKSGDVIEDSTGDLESVVESTIEKGKSALDEAVEKGKDLIEDVKEKGEEFVEEVKSRTSSGEPEVASTEAQPEPKEAKEIDPETSEKSARERLKDKGLL